MSISALNTIYCEEIQALKRSMRAAHSALQEVVCSACAVRLRVQCTWVCSAPGCAVRLRAQCACVCSAHTGAVRTQVHCVCSAPVCAVRLRAQCVCTAPACALRLRVHCACMATVKKHDLLIKRVKRYTPRKKKS